MKAIARLPIFWQTLLLLVAAVMVVQAVSIGLFLNSPPPRPDFNRLSDIAETLAGRRIDRRPMRMQLQAGPLGEPRDIMRQREEKQERQQRAVAVRERALSVTTVADEPMPDADMVSDDAFTDRLASMLDVGDQDVRLFFEADQRSNMPWARERDVLIRRGEPIFFDTVLAGVRTADGWRVVRTPPRPFLPLWQRRMLQLFALSTLVLAPFAWVFARALARPIRRIAEGADRMGANPQAPPIAEEGPAEIRTTAHALNRMQERLGTYLTERTNMIGAIAHDLRTPLARIAFRIEGAPDDMRQKVQGDIEQMRAMIAATISFVRDTSRIGTMAPVSLDALIADIAATEAEQQRPVTAGPVAPITVQGDSMALRRMLQNLIDNGVNYGGAVEITLARVGHMAELRVSDRGPGLPPDSIERMFKPFERGDPSRNRTTGGIGLGLSIARAIAQEHGGSLALKNRDGGGLAAVACLPIGD
ncbi:ATP-binding protein [Sphingomonas crocodyli]|uniref:histidine kinase n=1 Tax=Sphingomonas crocodyli TaxID=1979270 RepID=A0A437M4A1_9SPHN|nr:ATP-binding protein [Sphingomonas crocodyli]RVT92426.1 HAMP domain-containing protein [Sphingomonas crocodyli]